MNNRNQFKKSIIVAGIDIGSVNSKALILIDGEPISSCEIRTQIPGESAQKVIKEALRKINLNLDDIHYIVATGCGSSQVSFANKTLSEISCVAKGAIKIWGRSVRTILEAGGESCKVIHCTERGRVIDFLWNDKCSSGIGISIEVLANLVNKDLNDIGKIAFESNEFPKISDFCVVYARSEAFDLIKDEVPLEKIIAAYHYAMAKRISVFIERLGLKKDFVIVGGISRNPGITKWLKEILKIDLLAPEIDLDPALTGAFGAALFADNFYKQSIK